MGRGAAGLATSGTEVVLEIRTHSYLHICMLMSSA